MYIITINVHNTLTAEQQAEMFPIHAAWFKKWFDAGKFVMLGPYNDTEDHAGVIFAVTDSREELDAILAEDNYYPNFADYEIRSFEPKLIAANITEKVGK